MSNRRIDISASQQAEIDRLMTQITCDKGLNCVRTKFNQLCRAQQIEQDGESHLVCLEERGDSCRFYTEMNDFAVCVCPLRKIAARIVSGSEHF